MSFEKTISGSVTIAETTVFKGLVIEEGSVLSAPEGKMLTMSVNGVGCSVAPGKYEGEVVLTVTEDIPFQFYCFKTPHHYKAAVCTENGKYVAEKSVSAIAQGAKIADGSLKDAVIVTKEPAFNGVFVDGDGEYTIENCKIDLEGNGANDFAGYGAGVMTNGSVDLTVNNCDIHTKGAARGALFVGGHSNINVNNSRVSAENGTLPEGYKDTIGLGKMMAVPWMLGLRGNCRATNLVDYATAHYNNCHVTAESWGVLSTDIVDSVKLYVKDSLVEITGESGYGSYSIGDSFNSFENTTFNCPDYALIVANGPAGGRFTNCVVNTGRNAVMSFQNKGGELIVEDGSVFNTDKATFILKGSPLQIKVDRSRLNPANGVVVQVIDCDDPGNPGGWYIDPIGPDVANPERDLLTAKQGRDPIVTFTNMEVKGDIFNASSNLAFDRSGFPPMEMPMDDMPQDSPDAGIPIGKHKGDQAMNLSVKLKYAGIEGVISAATAKHAAARIDKSNCEELGNVINTPCEAVNNGVIVSLDSTSAWTVTGTSYLTSLELEKGAVIKGKDGKAVKMTVDGKETEIAAGKYTGKIVLSVA